MVRKAHLFSVLCCFLVECRPVLAVLVGLGISSCLSQLQRIWAESSGSWYPGGEAIIYKQEEWGWQSRREEDRGKRRREKRHTIDETSGSSGFGFSIRSYIAMITDCQLSCNSREFSLSFVKAPRRAKKRVGIRGLDLPWFIFELGFHWSVFKIPRQILCISSHSHTLAPVSSWPFPSNSLSDVIVSSQMSIRFRPLVVWLPLRQRSSKIETHDPSESILGWYIFVLNLIYHEHSYQGLAVLDIPEEHGMGNPKRNLQTWWIVLRHMVILPVY